MNASTAMADSLLRQACTRVSRGAGGRTRRSVAPATSPARRRAQTWRSFFLAPCAPQHAVSCMLRALAPPRARHCHLRGHGPLTSRGRAQTWRHLLVTPGTSVASTNLPRLFGRGVDLARRLAFTPALPRRRRDAPLPDFVTNRHESCGIERRWFPSKRVHQSGVMDSEFGIQPFRSSRPAASPRHPSRPR